MGHAGVGWAMQGCGGSHRVGVGHAGLGVGHVGVGWVMQGWDGSCRGGVGWVM